MQLINTHTDPVLGSKMSSRSSSPTSPEPGTRPGNQGSSSKDDNLSSDERAHHSVRRERDSVSPPPDEARYTSKDGSRSPEISAKSPSHLKRRSDSCSHSSKHLHTRSKSPALPRRHSTSRRSRSRSKSPALPRRHSTSRRSRSRSKSPKRTRRDQSGSAKKSRSRSRSESPPHARHSKRSESPPHGRHSKRSESPPHGRHSKRSRSRSPPPSQRRRDYRRSRSRSKSPPHRREHSRRSRSRSPGYSKGPRSYDHHKQYGSWHSGPKRGFHNKQYKPRDARYHRASGTPIAKGPCTPTVVTPSTLPSVQPADSTTVAPDLEKLTPEQKLERALQAAQALTPKMNVPMQPSITALSTTAASGAVNPLLRNPATAAQKKKLVWNKKSSSNNWEGVSLGEDGDEQARAKFRRLMGIGKSQPSQSSSETPATTTTSEGEKLKDKHDKLRKDLEQQYETSRYMTHLARGSGLGFGFSSSYDSSS